MDFGTGKTANAPTDLVAIEYAASYPPPLHVYDWDGVVTAVCTTLGCE